MSEINNKITLPFMTETEIAALSVSALSDRPNENSGQYGRKGLTPAELKAAFSALPVKIADRLNQLIPQIVQAVDAEIDGLNTGLNAEINGLSLSYDEENGEITLVDKDRNRIGDVIDLPTERVFSTARYEDGYLYLVFSNGDTIPIYLRDILPDWTQDLSDGIELTIDQQNAPPTSLAVKNYVAYQSNLTLGAAETDASSRAANALFMAKVYADEKDEEVKNYVAQTFSNAIKGTLSGGAVYLEDVDPLYTNLNLKSSTVPYQLFVSGRNILNTKADGVSSQNGASYVDTSDLGTIVWKTGGTYYVKIPVYIPKGCTVSYSIKWSAGSGEAVNQFSRVRFSGETVSNFVYDPVQAGILTDTFVASENIYNMLIYKNTSASPLTSDVTISEICVNLTDEAIYTPFLGYAENTIDQTMYPAYILADSVNEGVTLIPGRDYQVNITVEYLRDSTKVIDKLTRKIQALQNAAVT